MDLHFLNCMTGSFAPATADRPSVPPEEIEQKSAQPHWCPELPVSSEMSVNYSKLVFSQGQGKAISIERYERLPDRK